MSCGQAECGGVNMTREERAGWLWKALLTAEGKGRVVVGIKKKGDMNDRDREDRKKAQRAG